jgi:predicted RNA-binding Zn ribbon-like protein
VDFTHYIEHAAQTAADLVNTKGSITGNEYLGTPEGVEEFLRAHGFSPPLLVPEAGIAELHRVRDRLRAVFHASAESEAARLLNAILTDLEVTPYLTNHDGRWHMHYAPEDASLGQQVAAAGAMGLALVIAEHGFGRLGTCAADNCKDVFVDMSRNRSRRYCNEVCSSRMNVAAYRARHKTSPSFSP